jgi:hypothetical protein
MAAAVPAQLAAATTSNSNTDVIISWSPTTNDYGSAVTSYNIEIQQQSGSFSTYAATCDGTNSIIVSSTTCTIAMNVLTSSPFSLTAGDLIVATV